MSPPSTRLNRWNADDDVAGQSAHSPLPLGVADSWMVGISRTLPGRIVSLAADRCRRRGPDQRAVAAERGQLGSSPARRAR
jgi:hypothetical protein